MESVEAAWANEKNMLCPLCHVTLQMTERQGIEIDYCPQCRGVWLDRGELDKLIQQLAPLPHTAAPAAPPPPVNYPAPPDGRYADPHHVPVDPYHDPHRRRSFFDDLFGGGHGGRRGHH